MKNIKSHESSEMYLETILELEEENSKVRSIDIATKLNYTKPSVNRAIGVLKSKGYITHEPYGDIELTAIGREIAKRIHRTHHLITNFLVNTLGIDVKIAERDACRIEHIISPETVDAIQSYLKKDYQ